MKPLHVNVASQTNKTWVCCQRNLFLRGCGVLGVGRQVMEAQGLLLGTNASLCVCKTELSVTCVEVPGVLLGDALIL